MMSEITELIDAIKKAEISKIDLEESLKCLSAGLPPPNPAILKGIVEKRSAMSGIVRDETLLQNNRKGVFRIIQGPVGAGKTFVLQIAEIRIKHNGGVVSRINLSNTSGLSSKQSLIEMMSSLIYNFRSQNTEGLKEVLNQANKNLITQGVISQEDLIKKLEPLTSIPKGTDFRKVISAYLKGDLDTARKDLAYKWLTLEAKSKVELKKAFGIDQSFDEKDLSRIMIIWSKFFKLAGFSGGTLIILDELAEAYTSITKSKVDTCNKIIFELLNELFTGSSHSAGLGVYIGATEETVLDEKYGFYAHEALKSRIQELNETTSGTEKSAETSPVLKLLKFKESQILKILKRVGVIQLMIEETLPENYEEEIEARAKYVFKTWGATRTLRDLIKFMIDTPLSSISASKS